MFSSEIYRNFQTAHKQKTLPAAAGFRTRDYGSPEVYYLLPTKRITAMDEVQSCKNTYYSVNWVIDRHYSVQLGNRSLLLSSTR
jgi:hypothetical protein